jgi:hypothetical protein
MKLRGFVAVLALVCATFVVIASKGHARATAAAPSVTTSAVSTRTLLGQLVVAREHAAGYEPARFGSWTDADRDGCNTRHEVLIAEAVGAPQVGVRCALTGGRWVSKYDGEAASDPSQLVIDRLVPPAEAWESGAWRWSADTLTRYANDLGYGPDLLAVSARSHRAKGDSDPTEWMPPRLSFTCTYVSWWVAVKWRWRLAVDTDEKQFVSSVLTFCGWPSVGRPSRPSITTVLCRAQQRLAVHGLFDRQYLLRNTYWRGRRPMCISNAGGRADFTVRTPPGSDPDGRVAAFPNVYRGCIWNKCSPDAGMPIRVSALGRVAGTWHTREVASGSWNAAFELWFGKRRMTDGQADGAELMIWLNMHGQCCHLQPGAAKVRVAGRAFVLSHWRTCSRAHHVCFNYIQFRLVHRTWRVDRLPLTPFVRRCERLGLIRSQWWLENVGAGFEIWNGGRGLATTRFGVSMRP